MGVVDTVRSWLHSRTAPPTAQRNEVVSALLAKLADLKSQQRAGYDAARNPEDLAKYWANADHFDADSAHSKDVRWTINSRSRYELANNGYADGIGQTYATDLVGVGPKLRMLTGSTGFNQVVELQFGLWWDAVMMRRKLWCMAHAKHGDGEAFGVLRINPAIDHPIGLDVRLYEAEQVSTPMLGFVEAAIDGMQFDKFGNPVMYDLLQHHPGGQRQTQYDLIPEKIPARMMLHWFKLRRPGQHRGVSECASTLNMGAAFRRGREAQLSTWEKVASFTLLLKTIFEPEEIQALPPMASLDILYGMITALPNSVEPHQLRAEHPGPVYESFHKLLLNEMARPKNMPYNKAACDSSSYNYASGRLDHQTYYGSLDVDREDGNDLVMNKLFKVWLDMAIFKFGWLGGDPDMVGRQARLHIWDWPKHRVADVEAEANANKTKLETGAIFLPRLYSDQGMDFEDEVQASAQSFGITPEELKERLLEKLLPAKPAPPAPARSIDPADLDDLDESDEAGEAAVAAMRKKLDDKIASNGREHASAQ